MKLPLKNNSYVVGIAVTVVVTILLTLFCYFVSFPLVIPLLLLLLGAYIFYFGKAHVRLLLQLGLLLTILVTGTYFFINYTDIPPLYLPVATIAMLTMLLYNDLQVAFLMAFLSSALAGLLMDRNFDLMLIFFTGGLIGAFTVKDARTRGRLISAGLFIGLIQVLCVILLTTEMELVVTRYFAAHYLRPLLISGFIASFLILATSKIFETWFGVMSNFSLLELSDFNHPLLKRMILEAPGTYHHSLIVSNLTEAAADAIGANALLARVGAYYHDIGKLVKSEYFTENQFQGDNKHDQLEPSISKLVILNHVKEGVELGRRYKLNSLILDFIPQHHGTGLLYYFYQKALEEAKEGEDVREENFRYPGPKPQTKEAAVLMLADSVEGAVRALDEHSPSKIDEVVRKVINNKFIDGQLDECDLTLRDLEKISMTFTRVLNAMYHSRVKYPEKKNGSAKGPKGSSPQLPPQG